MQNATVDVALELRKLPDVCRQTGLSAATVYRLARASEFPKPIKIGARASAWIGEEIDAWIHARIAEARRAAA